MDSVSVSIPSSPTIPTNPTIATTLFTLMEAVDHLTIDDIYTQNERYNQVIQMADNSSGDVIKEFVTRVKQRSAMYQCLSARSRAAIFECLIRKNMSLEEVYKAYFEFEVKTSQTTSQKEMRKNCLQFANEYLVCASQDTIAHFEDYVELWYTFMSSYADSIFHASFLKEKDYRARHPEVRN